MKKLLQIILITLLFFSCKEEPTTPIDNSSRVANTIMLTEDWTNLRSIQIKFTPSENDQAHTYSYHLLINGTETEIYNSLLKDTTYTHKGLTEGTPYSYKIEAYEETELKDTSKTLRVNTLAVTSNDFTWKIDTLGQPGNFLNDVWGIDENNVWAVGYVNLEGGPSSVLKWNGESWTHFPDSRGVKSGIFGFDENNIVVCGESNNLGFIGMWNGSSWEDYDYNYFFARRDTVYPLNAVWGSSPEDIWAVGNSGTIIHYDGSDWSKVKVNIDTPIMDIWGNSASEIYLIAFESFGVNLSAIWKYDGNEWEKVRSIGIYNYGGNAVWKINGSNVLAGGKGLVEITSTGYGQLSIIGSRTTYITDIYGSKANNIFTVGTFGEINHYGGNVWQTIHDFETPYEQPRDLKAVWCTDNKVFIVGRDLGNVIIIRGTR